MLVILFVLFDTKWLKHNQFIVATTQNIYLLTFSYFTNINHPSSLFLQFYKSNTKHLGYTLEIKEADLGYTTVSSIEFNQLKYSQSFVVSVQNVYLLTLYYSIDIIIFNKFVFTSFNKETTNIWGITRR